MDVVICGVGVDLWCRRCGSVEHVEVVKLWYDVVKHVEVDR